MSPRYRDAYAVGLARGWEHANHAEHMEHRVITDAAAEADAAEVPLSYAEGDARSGWTTGYRDGIDAYHAAEDTAVDTDDAVAGVGGEDAMTDSQREALTALSERYGVEFRAEWFGPVVDLPTGYVGGWVGGPARRLYVGCDPGGRISS